MEIKCGMTEYLQQLSAAEASSDLGRLPGVAEAALRIITDIDENELTTMNIQYLHWLVESIIDLGHEELLNHIQEGKESCLVCAALARLMETPTGMTETSA